MGCAYGNQWLGSRSLGVRAPVKFWFALGTFAGSGSDGLQEHEAPYV